MSFISKIFTGGVDVNKAVDIVASAGDKLVFTQEERAETNMKATEGLSNFIIATADENTSRSITRRYIAILIITVYLFISLVIIGIACFNYELAEKLVELTVKLSLGTAFITVIGFFFGSYLLKKYVAPTIKQSNPGGLFNRKKKKEKTDEEN